LKTHRPSSSLPENTDRECDRFARRKELGARFRNNDELGVTLRYAAVAAWGYSLGKVAESEDK